MKAINIIRHIKRVGLNNIHYQTFAYLEDFYLQNGGAAEFVRQYFGGDFVAGLIKSGADYVAFWDGFQPDGCPDAVVTDNYNGKIYIYEVE